LIVWGISDHDVAPKVTWLSLLISSWFFWWKRLL